VPLNLDADCIDVCGTGGSGLARFNVSTAVAFVLAADGIRVAKHGNRGSRRANGSFDLLDALHCPFRFPPGKLREVFDRTDLCFIYARHYHPFMKTVARARTLANRRTIFNIAAPLCNPSNPVFQVVGTPTIENAWLVAEVLQRLGRVKCQVVCGAPGIDEVSISGATEILTVSQDSVTKTTLTPADLGLQPLAYETIPGGDAEENAVLFEQLINGSAPEPIVQMVCASAAVAMHCRGAVETVRTGYERCRTLLADGSVASKFEDFRSTCRALAE